MMTFDKIGEWYFITRNEKINRIIDELPQKYDEKSDKYNSEIHARHVSNSCMRQSLFSIRLPKPPSAFEAAIFIEGESMHMALQKLLGPLLKAKVEKRLVTEYGLVCSVDLMADVPIEMKTNRQFKRDIKEMYIDQLSVYLAALKKRKGVIIIIWMNNAREVKNKKLMNARRRIEAYNVYLTQKEYDKAVDDTKHKFFLLKKAINVQDVLEGASLLKPIKYDEKLSYLCRYCKWREECDKVD